MLSLDSLSKTNMCRDPVWSLLLSPQLLLEPGWLLMSLLLLEPELSLWLLSQPELSLWSLSEQQSLWSLSEPGLLFLEFHNHRNQCTLSDLLSLMKDLHDLCHTGFWLLSCKHTSMSHKSSKQNRILILVSQLSQSLLMLF